MSAWPGKYGIGLTGNIATGKSIVRRMLEHLGAFGIDADALGHRAIAQGAPGYRPVVEAFSESILDPDGQINRSRLAQVVFADPQALARLEAIVHPLVGEVVGTLVRRSERPVIVLEAIKLLEAGLGSACDSIWVTYAPREVQLARLVKKRGMIEAAAVQRIDAQPPQSEKLAAADVVIDNSGSLQKTWQQVNAAWQNLPKSAHRAKPGRTRKSGQQDGFLIQPVGPHQAEQLTAIIRDFPGALQTRSLQDWTAAAAEKNFLYLTENGRPVGVVGWKAENFITRIEDVYIQPDFVSTAALGKLLEEVESISNELQSEVSLLFLPRQISDLTTPVRELGYQQRTVQSLGVRFWQEAAEGSHQPGTVLFFKPLRQDGVLRPV